MSNSYVNFENSKALKEMGFDEPVDTFFCDQDFDFGFHRSEYLENFNHEGHELLYSAPHFSVAARWLQEKTGGGLRFFFVMNDVTVFWLGTLMDFTGPHAKNDAIAYGINAIKKQKESIEKIRKK